MRSAGTLQIFYEPFIRTLRGLLFNRHGQRRRADGKKAGTSDVVRHSDHMLRRDSGVLPVFRAGALQRVLATFQRLLDAPASESRARHRKDHAIT